jgi:uncharacterized repeat protein (TIGR03806 family)
MMISGRNRCSNGKIEGDFQIKMLIFKRLARSDPSVAVLLLALAGCGGSSGGPPPEDGTDPGEPAIVGLDERPVNSTCLAPPRPTTAFGVAVERAFPALAFEQPLFMLQAPDDGSRWFVLEKTGRVRAFDNQAGTAAASVFLDLSGIVNTASEGGLLGMAFAPEFATSHVAYVSYTRTPPGSDTGMESVVSRFSSADGGLTLDPTSGQVLLTINQPFANHNGGGIEFGPDGYLYIGMGDGGSGGDPQNNAQNTHNLLGTFLRIDVSGDGDYSIPPDNPFAGNPRCDNGAGAASCPEIYAWGLRNPWRFSFDSVTGRLWAGDVGQNAREEINVIKLGGNYGWRNREGFACFDPPVDCPSAGLVDPVLDYPHTDGRSVTGGYVFRGTALSTLQGRYVFGDFVSGRIWVLDADEHGTYGKIEIADTSLSISSFGEAHDGTLYVVDFGGGLYRLQPADAGPTETIPDDLAQTGCVDAANPATPAAGLIPYRPNAPYWSDGAASERWLALPEAAPIAVANGGELGFPPGAVLMQHFRRRGQLIETRLLVHHPDGTWAGYTYAWNAAQSEARRVVGGAVEQIGGEPWLYPSGAECMQCHTAAAGRVLGVELAQLNGELLYPATGRTANQLHTLDAIGLFAPPLAGDPADLPALPGPFGDASLGQRARAYLHTNCAGCHRPGGPTPSDIDLRYDTPLAQTGACDVAGRTGSDLGIPDVRLLSPGDAGRSLLWLRMDRRDVHAMPPVGSLEIDDEGVALVGAWIAALGGCS